MIGSYAAYTLKYLLDNKSDLVGLEIGCYDGELYFVFIDGLHTYEQVLKECNSFYTKVKLAVLEFMGNNNLDYKLTFNEFNLPFQFSTDIWYFIKE